ncbi:MAG: LVIVD repeat-containing protein [Cyclobacteriaceae bacterium]
MKKIFINFPLFVAVLLLFQFCSSDSEVAPGTTTGQGGSMARFTIAGDYLYIVDNKSLKPFNIADKTNIKSRPVINIEYGIETIFPYQNKLFVGARDGMHIFDITQPENPDYISTYRHITACDPVVVNENTAYVTLRAGTNCGGGVNVLDIIDISNPANPSRLNSYNMSGPYGLGVVDTLLFVCEGPLGMKVMNVKDPFNVTTLDIASDIDGFDVIPLKEQKILLMVGEDGFAQYDFSDPYNLKLLSRIDVVEN